MTTVRRPAAKLRKVPQQQRAEQTLATILEAAARVLETQGLDGFNTNLVAQRANVSVGSLYQYFHGKDSLIVALCKRERDVFFAEASGSLGEPTGLAALKNLITVSVHQQLRRPVLARLLDFQENRPPIARELAASTASFRELVRQILARDDLPPQPDLDTATDDVFAIIRAIVDAAGERGEVDRADLQRRVSRAVFGYLGVPDAAPSHATVASKSRHRAKRE